MSMKINKFFIENDHYNRILMFDMALIEHDNMLTDSFLSEFQYFINWDLLIRTYGLEENIIIKYLKYIDLKLLCQHQTLSEKFIVKYRDILDITLIYFYQTHISIYTINFIREILDENL